MSELIFEAPTMKVYVDRDDPRVFYWGDGGSFGYSHWYAVRVNGQIFFGSRMTYAGTPELIDWAALSWGSIYLGEDYVHRNGDIQKMFEPLYGIPVPGMVASDTVYINNVWAELNEALNRLELVQAHADLYGSALSQGEL